MSRINDSAFEKELRELDDDNPDYARMRRQIVLEAEKRRSGWKETTLAGTRSFRRSWIFSAAAGLLLCTAAAGAIFSQPDFMSEPASEPTWSPSETREANSISAGQSLGDSAAVNGVKLTLSNAFQGHVEGKGGDGEQTDRLSLRMSLNGLDMPNAEYAGFASSRLTNLESGKTQEWRGRSFDLRQGMESVYDSQMLDGDWTNEDGKRRFRFEANDLYMIRRHDVPLQGGIQNQTEYPIPSLEGASVLLIDSRWDEEQELLTLKYKLQGSNVDPSLSVPDSLEFEAQTELLLNTGSKMIAATSGGQGGDVYHLNYKLSGMSEQERQSLILNYSYVEILEKIEGVWQVDFTLDGTKAEEQAVNISPENAAEIKRKTGWTLGKPIVGEAGAYLLLDREPQDKKLHDGLVLYYDKYILAGEEFESAQGEHFGYPLTATSNQGDQGQESLSFRLVRENRWDMTKGPLSIRLQNAIVVREAPNDVWTALAIPQQKEQQVNTELLNGSVLHHRYLREGGDLKVVTETKDPLRLFDGTTLKVNGEVRKPDKESSYNSYREQGDYRVDFYKNVPNNAELELGLGFYGQIDSSLDTEIVLRKQ